MRNTITLFILSVTCLAIFKSATPFLSYKMNYEFILQERCEFRGTSQHEDCDGFCYLRKNIEHQHNGDSENPHSDKTVINSQFSSIYGVLESNAKLSTPISIDKPYPSLDSLSKYSIFLEVLSPPPRS